MTLYGQWNADAEETDLAPKISPPFHPLKLQKPRNRRAAPLCPALPLAADANPNGGSLGGGGAMDAEEADLD